MTMSRMAALVFLAAAASGAPPAATAPAPDGGGLTAEQAMAAYRETVDGALAAPAGSAACRSARTGEILVCRRTDDPSPRLPMPDARAEPGEVVRRADEMPRPGTSGPPAVPSRLGETIAKGIGLLRSAITGEDRGF